MTKTDTRQVLEEAFNVRRAIEAIPIGYTFVEIDGREYEMVEKYELSQFRNELASVMEQALAIAQAALRTGQLVPVQQPSESYDPAQNCLEVPPNILASGKRLAAMRKSAQPSGDVVEAVADAMRAYQASNRTWRMEDLATAAITAYEALRAKDTRP